jgi:para-nitrobenzyl esterase
MDIHESREKSIEDIHKFREGIRGGYMTKKANRRKFFQMVGAGATGLTVGAGILSFDSCRSISTTKGEDDEQILFIGDNIALVKTSYGKVRGYKLRGIYYFLGIPYGADTSGSNRFMLPKKPKPWMEVFPAIWWGNTAPPNMQNRYANKYASFRDHWNYDDVSEDCLRINIFTPDINDGQKRPVMLWLHSGGFTNGNGIEQDGYNGENLAKFGNIVFCSINHRLGPLGYTNLAGVGGDRFAASNNVGMLDIVAAMEWTRDNIEKFGGDPDNVSIMDQSGGGAKVCLLTAMPSAERLFHKAVVLSGASTRAGEKEYAERLGSYVLNEAGLSAAQIDKLQEMPWEIIM